MGNPLAAIARFIRRRLSVRRMDRVFREGLQRHQERDHDGARERFRTVLVHDPEHVDAHFYLGLSSVFAGDLEEARTALLRVIELDPDHFGAHANLGTLYVKQAEFDQAIACYQKALTLATSQRAAVHYFLANTYARTGKHDKALPHYMEALDEEPHNLTVMSDLVTTFYRLERWNEVKDLSDRVLAADPAREALRGQREIADLVLKGKISSDSLPYFEQGLVAYGRGRYHEARRNFEAAVELSPTCSLYHHCLGTTHDLLGEFDDAFDEYLVALREDPRFYRAAEAHTNLAAIYGKKGMFREARDACRRALEIRPDYPMAFANLGSAYLGMREWQRSREASMRAVALDDDNVIAHTSLAFVSYELGDARAAWVHLRRAEELGTPLEDLRKKLQRLRRDLAGGGDEEPQPGPD
jgi:tetratricopeptide (TPR) repeat protein